MVIGFPISSLSASENIFGTYFVIWNWFLISSTSGASNWFLKKLYACSFIFDSLERVKPSWLVISHIDFCILLCIAYLWKNMVLLSPFCIQRARLLSLHDDSSIARIFSFLILSALIRFNSSCLNIWDCHLSKSLEKFVSMRDSSTFCCFFFFFCQLITSFFRNFIFSHNRIQGELDVHCVMDAQVNLISEIKSGSISQELLNLKGAQPKRWG